MHIICKFHEYTGNLISLSREDIQVNCASFLFSGTFDYLVKINDQQDYPFSFFQIYKRKQSHPMMAFYYNGGYCFLCAN